MNLCKLRTMSGLSKGRRNFGASVSFYVLEPDDKHVKGICRFFDPVRLSPFSTPEETEDPQRENSVKESRRDSCASVSTYTVASIQLHYTQIHDECAIYLYLYLVSAAPPVQTPT